MRNYLLGAIVAAGLAVAPAANAVVTFTSKLEYKDGVAGAFTPTFGLVTIEEISPTLVQLTVSLTNPLSLLINTGGPHDPFTFNTVSDDGVSVSTAHFSDGGHGSFAISGFGTMTDRINYDGQNGGGHGLHGPLVFTVSNLAGITFAGLGYHTDANGKITTLGTGEHFKSNNDGWWFTADIYDGATGFTYNVGARDAFAPGGVPEPATWAMMLVGFGGMGALLRRSRRVARAATA